jgi:predicted Ser/Thr protein kinase
MQGMTDEGRVSELLLRWQQSLAREREAPVEELCRDHPDLVEELRRRIGILRRMGDLVQRLQDTTADNSCDPQLAGAPTLPGYEVLGELGRGGMGVVYKARQTATDRVVAVKVILSPDADDAEHRQRFRREAEAVANLRHPNVVHLHTCGEADGHLFLVLEYLEGGSLAERCGGRPLPPDQAARLVEAVARAVHTCHEQGVVHRDLKPANILLGPGGVPKVADFGLARRDGAPTHTRTGAVLGTPSYMAPEQAEGNSKHVGPACDVYALGAILYECLTGRPPFKAETSLDTLVLVLTEEPTSPSQLRPGVPAPLETICLRCLRKAPPQRYATALDIADNLARFLRGEPIRSGTARRRDDRRFWLTAALPVLIAASAAVVAGLLLNWAAPPRPPDTPRDTLLPVVRTALDCGVTGLTFVGDGSQFACAGKDGTLRILDVKSGAEVRRIAAHAGPVLAVAASPDRTRLLSGDEDGFVRLWDGRGEKLLEVGGPAPVRAVAFAPDGKRFVSGDGVGSVRLHDAVTGREVWKATSGEGPVRSVAVSPDGLHVAAGGVRAWLGWADTGQEFFAPAEHRDVAAVAFTPDAAAFAVAGADRPMPVLWETSTGLSRATFQVAAECLTFSPDGWLVALGGHRREDVRVCSRLTGRAVVRCAVTPEPPQRGGVGVLAFAPDRPLLLGGCGDGTVMLWDLGAAARAERRPVKVDKLEQHRNSLAADDGPEAWHAVGALAADPATALRWLGSELRPTAEPDLPGFAGLLQSTRPRGPAAGLLLLEQAGEMADPVLRQLLREELPDDLRPRLDSMLARLRAPTKAPERVRALRTLEVLHLVGAAEEWASARDKDDPTPGVREARGAAWAKIARLAEGASGACLTRRAQATLRRHHEWLLFAE